MKEEILRVTEYMRNKRIRITSERLKIIEEVFGIHDHFDADALYRRMVERDDSVSRATVYRTLDLLVEGGFATRNHFHDNVDRYEHVLGHKPHGHIVCLDCQQIQEFEDSRLDAALASHAEKAGYDDRFHIAQVFGICPACRKKREAMTPMPPIRAVK